MASNNHRFVWTTQGSLTAGQLVPILNHSLRGLMHDFASQVLFNDHLPRTITAAHSWSVPIKLNQVTAPATIANVGQLFVDTADGTLKFLGGNGTLTPLAGP